MTGQNSFLKVHTPKYNKNRSYKIKMLPYVIPKMRKIKA